MTMRAKYAGTCRKCGGNISPGTEIEWERGAGASHTTCPTAPNTNNRKRTPPATGVILSDEQITEILSRDGRELLPGAPSRVLTRSGKNAWTAGEVIVYRGTRYLVVQTHPSRYYTQDDLDDNDDFDMAPGWSTNARCHAVTATAAELEAIEQAKREREAADQAKRDVEARVNMLREVPDGWTMYDGPVGDFTAQVGNEAIEHHAPTLPDRSEWVEIGAARTETGTYSTRYQAGQYIVLDYGSYDDWRSAVLIPPDLLDAYMSREAASRSITRQAADEWLAQYRGCVGTALYEWVVAHVEVTE